MLHDTLRIKNFSGKVRNIQTSEALLLGKTSMLCIYTTRHDVCKICILNHYILFLSAIVDKKEATGPKRQVLKDRLAFLFASSGIIANYHNINYVGVPAVLLSYNILSNFILVSK